MAKQEDRVTIKFGPSKYDNPKKIREELDDIQTQLEQPSLDIDAIEDIVKELSGDLYIATAQQQIVGYGAGDVIISGESSAVTAANSTGQVIGNTDVVVVGDAFIGGNSKTYVIVGIVTPSGQITPIPTPSVTLDPNFPLDTEALPNSIIRSSSSATDMGRALIAYPGYDQSGLLGAGTDCIVGVEGLTSPAFVNAFGLNNTISSSLFATATTSMYSIAIDSNGRTYQYNPNQVGTSFSYRDLGAVSWTTFSPSPALFNGRTSYDSLTGTMWVSGRNSSTGQAAFYKMGPSDASPVSAGNLGVTAWTATSANSLVAHNGFLYFSKASNQHYVKSASDTANFTLVSSSTFSTNLTNPFGSLDQSGNVWAINNDCSQVYKIDYSSGIASTFFTGFSTPVPGTLTVSQGNQIIITATIEETLVGGAAGVYLPALIAFDGVSSSAILYYDPLHTTTTSSYIRCTPPLETTLGSMLFLGVGWSTAPTYAYRVTGV